MDIKLVILLAVAIAIIFLLMNEMSTLREEIDKKMSELNNRITNYNEDTKTSFKREAKEMSTKYKAFTTDMVKELRTMNSIENQVITQMSDQFAEGDSVDRIGIPHLSDIHPRHGYRPLDDYHGPLHHHHETPERTNSKSSGRTGEDGEAYYMSPVSDEFRIKDDGDLLPSAKMQNGTDEESENEDGYDEEDRESHEEESEDVESGDEEEFDEDDEEMEEGDYDEEDDEDDGEEFEEEDEEVDDEDDEEGEDDEDVDEDDEEEVVDEDEEVENSEEADETRRARLKLESYRKIRASMEDDEEDLSSENITFGSTNKGTQITVKGISKRKKEDDLSVATEDDEFRLKSISRYSKQDLIDIAVQRGLNVSVRSNKTTIYDAIKQNL
jgi:hypothetical protein